MRPLPHEGQRLESTNIDEVQSKVLETIRERAVEGILSVEKIRTYKLGLSYGGPADYFERDWSDDSNEWVGGRYVFQDWFDGANRSISAELAEQLADLYGVDPEIG